MPESGPETVRPKEEPLLARAWRKLPVVVRAVLVGLSVSVVGGLLTGALLQANLKVRPDVPWSLPLAALWLWSFWSYLGGRGWPRGTSARRRECLRAHPLSAAVWFWSLLTCGLLLCLTVAIQSIVIRFSPAPALLPTELLALPPVTVFFVLLTISAQAGLVEEAAFRGYMFTPIEQRHGPVAASLIVSSVFVLAHFNNPQNVTGPRVAYIFVVGVVYCVLVTVTNSILPGLVAHAVGNAIGLLLLWRAAQREAVTPSPLRWDEALREPTLIWLGVGALLAGLGAIWSFTRLMRVTRPGAARST